MLVLINDASNTTNYTLSLHDALPILPRHHHQLLVDLRRLRQRIELARMHATRHQVIARALGGGLGEEDRKSTRLNSSHSQISYAVFCLKKKKIRVKLSNYRGDDEAEL